MQVKPPFEAAHNCICAYPDMPILEFYKEYFDTVYIILHPFYKTDEKGNVTQVFSWHDMVTLTGFKDINQLDIAMRNSIGGLNKEWENVEDVEILVKACKANDIWIPSEGAFQETLEGAMLKSMQEQGHHYLFIADEYGFERKMAYIQDMIDGKDDTVLTWGHQGNWYTNKNEILYTTHWDSHFTLLCSDTLTINNIIAQHHFEGFYCNSLTEIYWSLPL